jgi:hypothetical protein
MPRASTRARMMSDVTDADAATPTTADPTEAGHPDYANAIYGSLLVTSLIAVQWRHDPSTDFIAFSLIVSVVVFWLAHVWSEIVNRRVHGPISAGEAGVIAFEEAPMLAAGILPAAVLGLARVFGIPIDTVVSAALIVCIGQLFVWGLIVGRAAHSGRWLALRVAIVDSLLGVAIVGLKVLVIH